MMTDQVLATTVIEYLAERFEVVEQPAERDFFVWQVSPSAENAGTLKVKRSVTQYSSAQFAAYLRKFGIAARLETSNQEITDPSL